MARPKEHDAEKEGKVVIKKYANRRLYDTEKSSYVTLQDLVERVKANEDFVVVDAKSGEDLTRSVLTQIIIEEESKGENLLPLDFLKKLIGFYGENMGPVFPTYLKTAMDSFIENQERLQQNFAKNMQDAGKNPFGAWEEIGKQNMAIFEETMKKTMQQTADMMQPFSIDKNMQNSMGDFPMSPVDQMRVMQEQMNQMQKALATMMQTEKSDKDS